MFKEPKLTIEIVPGVLAGQNVRNTFPEEWGYIRDDVLYKANYCCKICRNEKKLHCHEVWHYDTENQIQKLLSLMALCYKCHSVKHINLPYKFKNEYPALTTYDEAIEHPELIPYDEAIEHLASINKWTIDEAKYYAESHLRKALNFPTWPQEWKLDLNFLKKIDLYLPNIENIENLIFPYVLF